MPLERVSVYSRRPEPAAQLAAETAERYGVDAGAAASVEEALRDADVVVTATTAREPIVERGWFAPGAHVNAVGSSIPTTRELDGATVAAARLVRRCARVDAQRVRRPPARRARGDGRRGRAARRAGRGAERQRSRANLAGRAHGLHLARAGGRGPRGGGARAAQWPPRRDSGPRCRGDPTRLDHARARDAQRRRAAHAARAPAAGRRPGRDLPEARVPAADRLVQDPRRAQRDGRGAARARSSTASSRRARATWPRAWPGERASAGVPCTVVVPDTRAEDEAGCDRAAGRAHPAGAVRGLVARDRDLAAPGRRGLLRASRAGRRRDGRQRHDRPRDPRGPARRRRRADPVGRRRADLRHRKRAASSRSRACA